MKDPIALSTYVLASRATKAAGVILVLGWLPLLMMIFIGDANANPIGLGLLAWLATLIALLSACVGSIRGFQRWRVE